MNEDQATSYANFIYKIQIEKQFQLKRFAEKPH